MSTHGLKVLTREPMHFIDKAATLLAQPNVPQGVAEGVIAYARNYAICWYGEAVPARITERINALEGKWLLKQRDAG